MKQHIDNTRRQLGELGAMSAQTEAMERKILERAQHLLGDIEGKLDQARADALSGDDAAKAAYAGMVDERGRLQQVIAQAHTVLEPA